MCRFETLHWRKVVCAQQLTVQKQKSTVYKNESTTGLPQSTSCSVCQSQRQLCCASTGFCGFRLTTSYFNTHRLTTSDCDVCLSDSSSTVDSVPVLQSPGVNACELQARIGGVDHMLHHIFILASRVLHYPVSLS